MVLTHTNLTMQTFGFLIRMFCAHMDYFPACINSLRPEALRWGSGGGIVGECELHPPVSPALQTASSKFQKTRKGIGLKLFLQRISWRTSICSDEGSGRKVILHPVPQGVSASSASLSLWTVVFNVKLMSIFSALPWQGWWVQYRPLKMSQFWSPGSLVQKFILNNFPISGRRKKEKKKKRLWQPNGQALMVSWLLLIVLSLNIYLPLYEIVGLDLCWILLNFKYMQSIAPGLSEDFCISWGWGSVLDLVDKKMYLVWAPCS